MSYLSALTFPKANRTESKYSRIPNSTKNTPNPDRPTPISRIQTQQIGYNCNISQSNITVVILTVKRMRCRNLLANKARYKWSHICFFINKNSYNLHEVCLIILYIFCSVDHIFDYLYSVKESHSLWNSVIVIMVFPLFWLRSPSFRFSVLTSFVFHTNTWLLNPDV